MAGLRFSQVRSLVRSLARDPTRTLTTFGMDLGQGFVMASPINAVFGALVATAFWTVLGYALARHVLPKVLAIGAAPVSGWAAFSAASLPILSLIGFSSPAVVGLAALGFAI